jgi:peptidoglycan/xylan/chitin deacetylase (PgdA/CDA1 family)
VVGSELRLGAAAGVGTAVYESVPHALDAAAWDVADGAVTQSGANVAITRTSSDTGTYTRAFLDMSRDLRNKTIIVQCTISEHVHQVWGELYCTSRTASRFNDGFTVSTKAKQPTTTTDVFVTFSPLTLPQGGGTYADLADFRRLAIRVYLVDGQATATFTVKNVFVADTPPPPGAVMCFSDDAYASWHDFALPLLSTNGFKASLGVVTNWIGSTYLSKAIMTQAQLDAAYAAGWDLASHSVTHSLMTSLSASALDDELRNSQQALAAAGWTRGHRHFIYPGLDYNDAVIAQVRKYYLSARGPANTTFFAGWPLGDQYRWGHHRYVTSSVTAATLTGHIDRLAAFGGMMAFTFHDIVADDAAITQTTDTTQARFTAFLDQWVASGARSVTISEAYEYSKLGQFQGLRNL